METITNNQAFIELLVKIGMFLIAMIAIPKFFMDYKFLHKDKLKDDYSFVESIVAKDKYKDMHDFLLEKSFHILFNFRFTATEIRFFLNKSNPMKIFTDFIKSAKFIEIAHEDDGERLAFKPKYKNKKTRKRLFIKNNILYIIFFSIGMMPIIAYKAIAIFPLHLIIAISVFSFIFIVQGIAFLVENSNLEKAEKLVDQLEILVSSNTNATK